jgi:hypothetical protein
MQPHGITDTMSPDLAVWNCEVTYWSFLTPNIFSILNHIWYCSVRLLCIFILHCWMLRIKQHFQHWKSQVETGFHSASAGLRRGVMRRSCHDTEAESYPSLRGECHGWGPAEDPLGTFEEAMEMGVRMGSKPPKELPQKPDVVFLRILDVKPTWSWSQLTNS